MEQLKVSNDEVMQTGELVAQLMATIKKLEEENKTIKTEWTMCDRACKMWTSRCERMKQSLYQVTLKTREDEVFAIANNAVESYYESIT